ncbi:sodium:solute symporter family protein [Brevibacillus porteri]|uniref:Sodium:solute symporter n=1 Tax=Brevibacillus porteri TaxID=2126350 RepID=A0ABX5FKT2_9BACL|nr:sodium:solute symporter [Brevibacillus porteri]MED1799831.1 sodium:solute symporter [Brevibacillus porteri]MED2132855.1 sodium:solute symporter [Brevibacillus porteri]MED2744232.1 sodium:solute symporter [Brevibacillus porteri]MED2816728.1 sodium:solute symporter [Brevibacillus porteri]MED2894302.1 sodium:solute symporter [Brevibacillus porteri]
MNISILITFAFLLAAILLAIRSSRGKKMSLEQWSVGGRGFGTVFVFLLLAGEFFTSFTFLGGSGMIYQVGSPAYYVLAYMTLAYVFSYYLLPPVWRYAKEHGIVSISDFFRSKYQSPFLGVLVSIVGIIASVPVVVLQLKGLGIIVSETSYGMISPTLAVWIGTIAVTVYVMISGIHGAAWTAAIKDISIVLVVVFLGLYLPYHYLGGLQPMFEAVQAAKPDHLTLPEQGQSVSWVISTVLLTAFGFYMQPGLFAAALSAKSEKVFRRNTIIMPLYTLLLLFVFFVGYTAILQVPGLKGADGDLALLRLSLQTFDPWFIGIIGGVGVLTALVPTSVILLTIGTLFATNIYKPLTKTKEEGHIAKVAKVTVPVTAFISLYFVMNGGNALYALLLMSFSLITQLFPSLLLSLLPNNQINKYGAFWGILVGVITVAYLTLSKTTIGTLFPDLPQVIKDFNPGFIALFVNVLVAFLVSRLKPF